MKDIGGVGMISFIICLALLIGGYFVYGKVVENTFAPDDRETPAVRINDGVDYVSVPREEELLDHSGTGNIHECSFHDIFLLCRRVSGTFYEGCLSGRNYSGSSIPWNLYPCYKETNESIVVRQRNLNT